MLAPIFGVSANLAKIAPIFGVVFVCCFGMFLQAARAGKLFSFRNGIDFCLFVFQHVFMRKFKVVLSKETAIILDLFFWFGRHIYHTTIYLF